MAAHVRCYAAMNFYGIKPDLSAKAQSTAQCAGHRAPDERGSVLTTPVSHCSRWPCSTARAGLAAASLVAPHSAAPRRWPLTP